MKMKEEGDDWYKQFNERITNIVRKILDMDEKYENRSEVIKGEHVDENQGKTVIAGFHSETTESEVMQLLKELINDAPRSRSHTHSFTSKTMEKEKHIHQVSEHVEKRTERKKNKDNEINGRRRKVPQQKNGVCQILHSHETTFFSARSP